MKRYVSQGVCQFNKICNTRIGLRCLVYINPSTKIFKKETNRQSWNQYMFTFAKSIQLLPSQNFVAVAHEC